MPEIPAEVSIPQSGFGAFEPVVLVAAFGGQLPVSIPQSGFGAFELLTTWDYEIFANSVSIPQSGFGAFELAHLTDSRFACWVGFNPSVGIRGV